MPGFARVFYFSRLFNADACRSSKMLAVFTFSVLKNPFASYSSLSKYRKIEKINNLISSLNMVVIFVFSIASYPSEHVLTDPGTKW
ncbi:hypothetical protein Y032_0607g589 [Ancylostoma ceylanicum]|uniref:Uncharacterized protein n=1 Tax=Ancylostoma ceylanicum TaxID=53326 RepID=A0A016WMU7_9BILA|nr:hypothetical protein Y032_0607g589 [Ancylostoma ceylanicum]